MTRAIPDHGKRFVGTKGALLIHPSVALSPTIEANSNFAGNTPAITLSSRAQRGIRCSTFFFTQIPKRSEESQTLPCVVSVAFAVRHIYLKK
jgi:hypothetical protein